ncbi:MAG: FAD/NAD(P)-binding oxidoreductase [Pseudomonadota bacterium]
MAHIVILGAGIGGMPAAYEARELLGKEHSITVINATDYFQFVPSNPWVAVGWRTRDEITFPIEPYLKRKGIDFIASAVNKIDADNNTLHLDNGETVNYDYLVITTGPKLNFPAIEGAGPHGGHTHSVCTVDHAELAYQDFQKLCDNPGHVIVGAFQGASCYGPAYEYVFILDAALRKKKLRNKVPITFVTAEPYIGHLGLGGVGDSKGMLESELRMHDIKWICNARTTKVEAGKMFVEELDMQGNVVKTHELGFNHSMMLPPFRGVDAVAALGEGVVNPGGFVLIDDKQRNPKYKNIYSAGVCVAIPPVEATPVPVGAPKTGYMIESMVTAIVHNIEQELKGQEPTHKGTWQAICLADMGDRGAAFIALPQIPPRNVNWFAKGKWVHLAKIAFEKYFIRKMKSGTSEPLYEKYVLKAIGIERLAK